MDVSDTLALLRAVQAVELEMLEELLRICKKYSMSYFLLGGSALGAVRHAGFIPWDDDIDLGMPRPDYERFMLIAQTDLQGSVFLQSNRTDPSFPHSFAKIRLARDMEGDRAEGRPSPGELAQVDVFPLDGYPSRPFRRRVVRFLVHLYRAAILQDGGRSVPVDGTILKRAAAEIVTKICRAMFTRETLVRRLDNVMTAHAYDTCDIVVNWNGFWGLREAVPRKFFGRGQTMEFEGVAVVIPIDHDNYLKSLYGDYMALPPLEQRVSPHFPDLIGHTD